VNILIINHTKISINWGAEATAIALEDLFISAGHQVNSITTHSLRPDAYLPSNVAGFSGNRIIWHLLQVYFKRFGTIKFPTGFFEFEYFANLWMKHDTNEILDKLKWADIIVHNGQNSMSRSSVSNSAIRSLFLCYLAKAFYKKTVISVNSTVYFDEYDHFNLKDTCKNVLPTLDFISVRDPRSKRMLESIIDSDVHLIADPVLTLPAKQKMTFPDRKPRIYISEGEYKINSIFFSKLLKVLKDIYPDYDIFGLIKDNQNKALIEICKLNNVNYYYSKNGWDDFFDITTCHDIHITGRYHYAVMSVMNNNHFVPIQTHSPKLSGFTELIYGSEAVLLEPRLHILEEKLFNHLLDFQILQEQENYSVVCSEIVSKTKLQLRELTQWS
jgi:polysaccharide pyruvyl transferase WcaK-like protein